VPERHDEFECPPFELSLRWTIVTAVIETTQNVDRWLDTDLDEWTRRVVRRHFAPEVGSRFWLQRRASLSFDPMDITRYDQLVEFGPFPLHLLAEVDPADLVPRDVPRPLAGRVWESGGTNGKPSRVFYTPAMAEHHRAWRMRGLREAGIEPGRTWLYACPSGPHIVGRGADQIAEHSRATVYTMDLDPRYIKQLIRESKLAEMQSYVGHVIEQMTDILSTGRVDYLETTPAIMASLIDRHPDLIRSLSGICLGGTTLTPAMYRQFRGAMDGGRIGVTYGNTFGCAIGLDPRDDGDVLPYVPGYPQVTMVVTDKENPMRVVDYGKVGRVMLSILHDDLFLPNIFERDQAMRFDTGGDWPCDGVANVSPLQITRAAPEGLY
jgi:hypothetical protein